MEGFEDNEVFDNISLLGDFENTDFNDESFGAERFNTLQNNTSFDKSTLNVSALCCDEEISGYDKLTGQTWIYPTNYPVRDYQFNIIKATLLKNTLVSLPTGLGKTFIAAVIMYNFYRWYPLGKIVFTAPTRPLVAQQIEACYNIIAIPPKDTIEMTGHMQVNTRKTYWETKRVFFATPQVIYNDIKSGICPGAKLRCLVIDEAHRARGNYAYCQIVSTLTEMGHKTYRILALSATPGSKVEDVINVVKSLHIAHLELRTENCIDVAPYSHSRNINTVIIQLGPELSQLRHQYVEILDSYARRLKQFNILPQNLGNLSKGRIVMLYKEYQCKERGARHPQHNYIMKDFTILIALYHGLELLVKHGSRVFLNFFDEHPEKSWIQADDRLTALLERLRDDLGVNPLSLDRSILPDGTVPEMPKNLCFGHPKFYKLKEIMMDHFLRAKQKNQDTRAIVFCEYRESVNLVHCLLLQCRPLITPQMFVGQGASGKDGKAVVSQKQQLRVMRNFREGACNTLVATCVAEEGLDVGSVDLILCFDISTRSPIRLVQRCGRTGRERGGQVYILVTEGREHQTLTDCMRQRDGLNKKILQSKEVQNNLYKYNPRMMPQDFTPQCQKMYITVAQNPDPKEKAKGTIEKTKKGQKDLRSMLVGRSSSSYTNSSIAIKGNQWISEAEFKELFPDGYSCKESISTSTEYWCMNKETFLNTHKSIKEKFLKLSTWLEWQRTLQKTINIDHSTNTEILSELLQYCDAKRFEELPPSTQDSACHTQNITSQNAPISTSELPSKVKSMKKKIKNTLPKSPCKKDGDIRALFSTATKSTKNYTKLLKDLGIQSDGNLPTRLINLLVDLSLENTSIIKKCHICCNVCNCSILEKIRKNEKKRVGILERAKEIKLPDIHLLDDIQADIIINYSNQANKSINNFSIANNNEIENINLKVKQKKDMNEHNCSNFELNFDFESPIKCDIVKDQVDTKTEPKKVLLENNFEIGDIEDIFADSSPDLAIEINSNCISDKNNASKEALDFFGLDSIEDIFADYDDSSEDKSLNHNINVENSVNIDKTSSIQSRSPSILSRKQKADTTILTSPILCSQNRKYQSSVNKEHLHEITHIRNTKKKLTMDPPAIDSSVLEASVKKNTNTNSGVCNLTNTSDKSMLTITQLVEMINKPSEESMLMSSHRSSHSDVDKRNVRSTSPILLTQADRKKCPLWNNSNLESNIAKTNSTQSKKRESLIILDSDSDSNDTIEYRVDDNVVEKNPDSPLISKRKLSLDEDVEISSSPYFIKRQKLSDENEKALTLQQKVLAALTSNKFTGDHIDKNNDENITFSIPLSSLNSRSQKENENPTSLTNKPENYDENKECDIVNCKDMLQQFRYNSKNSPKKAKFTENSITKILNGKRKLDFSDSDDDFINKMDSFESHNSTGKMIKTNGLTKLKLRKDSKKRCQFLDQEAELSNSGEDDSGDELSDESVGSIVDFICDNDDTHVEVDMHAHYLKSVKSPMKGVFKIPDLPNKNCNMDIISQYVEEDSYEMDSFCVNSQMGLTQVNEEVSELDLAEIILKKKRKRKKRKETKQSVNADSDNSPVIRRPSRNVKRLIKSDSDDSS